VNSRRRISLPYVASNTVTGRMQATLAAWLTIALLVLVDAYWVTGYLFTGEGQLSTSNLLLVNTAGLLIVGWFSLLASAEETDALLALLAKPSDAPGREPAQPAAEHPDPRGLLRVLTNLWIPVTFQFALVGGLLWASGGPYSPFVVVPSAMVFIGQSVYRVPSIELCEQPNVRDLLLFAWRVIRFYAYPQLIFASLLGVVALLQIYHPLRTRPAPIAETMLATQLTLSIGMCVVFVARRSDRAGASGGGGTPGMGCAGGRTGTSLHG
jgi:hypothetical protein